MHALVTPEAERTAVVPFQRNTNAYGVEEPVGTMRAGGFHHGVITANFDPGWSRRAGDEPFGSVTCIDHHSLVVPYNRTGHPTPTHEPTPTATTHDRMALLVPESIREEDGRKTEWTDSMIEDCGFRMFDLPEIARVMQMHEHTDGGEYVVVGNKRERMAQYGNAVTPPAMELLIGRLSEVIA
jgi:DNA (cytosine-5)-methyltransferase 1